MAEFLQPEDIANVAAQTLGVPRIFSLANDSSRFANEANFRYDKLRTDELARALWTFATRRVTLRACDYGTYLLTFPAWASGTTYGAGAVVSYQNILWVSLAAANSGNTPGSIGSTGVILWDQYFGSVVANQWNYNNVIASTTNAPSGYNRGELVYKTPGDGTNVVYSSLIDGNTNDPAVVDAWDISIAYNSGEVVSYNSTNYQSRVNLNLAYQPDISATQWTSTVTNPTVSRSWLTQSSVTLAQLPIIYPLKTGPASDPLTRNAFRKPAGWLRKAPLDPKAGSISRLGADFALQYDDRLYEGDYIVTGIDSVLIDLRFIANTVYVAKFDPMFSNALGQRIAYELAEIVTGSAERKVMAYKAYEQQMHDARAVDAIETGAVELPQDDYLTARM